LNDVDVDGNGHGTHCAGTIASRKYGVAKAANVIAVKVLGSNGSGTTSDVVGGITYAVQASIKKAVQAAAELKATGRTRYKGSVANMSLGGGKSRALDQAVNRAVDSGLHFAVAAGNDNRDACDYSPAGAENAVTVGATTITDERAYFSNHGKCVDVLAPGLNIKSAWIGGRDAENTISGTSMASPHIAGLLAYLLSLYPTKDFSPESFEETVPQLFAETATQLYPVFGAFQRFYAIARAVLPTCVVDLLPASEINAPIPSPISGVALKRLLISLATQGKITDLPAGTPNLLAFNNATA